jgi:phosphoglycerate dehydrogenase-like enzyme
MHTPLFVVLFDVESVGRQVIREVIGTAADILYLPDVDATARAEVLRRATVILAQNPAKELTPDELALIHQVRLVQFYTAGVDFIPLQALPADLPIAANRGASAEPMAEHALALTLAAAKRLFFEHRQLATGAFNQFTPNRMLAGRVCGLFGFGGIGVATARLMRAMGMQIHAINRRALTGESPQGLIGPDERLR